MVKYRNMFYEPVRWLSRLKNGHSAEMSEEQLAFLCGLLREYHPEKIVEVGVAAGGTTAVILNCISMLGLESQCYSLDLSTFLYRDKSKKTGYLAEECKKVLGREVQHFLYTGKYAVQYLEEIGENIDFLILDTVHSMPGELLDFLAFYPFLKQNAVVVLHDIVLNHFHDQPTQIATKVLFDTAVAEKMYGIDDNGTLLNIGAFMITEDTGKYIDSIFSALTLTWNYQLQKEELLLYRDFYSRYYSLDCMELFDLAVSMNQRTWEESRNHKKKVRQDEFLKIYRWIEMVKTRGEVYIYGCGYFGKRLYDFLEQCGIRLKGYIISDGQSRCGMKNVFYLSEVHLDEAGEVILLGVNSSLHEEIGAKLLECGIKDYMIPEKYVYSYLA